jgi:hypothetical protein
MAKIENTLVTTTHTWGLLIVYRSSVPVLPTNLLVLGFFLYELTLKEGFIPGIDMGRQLER